MMMKRPLALLATLLFLLQFGLSSCKPEEIPDDVAEEEPENEVAPLCSITLEGEKVTLLEIRGEASSLVIQVTANKEWTLSSNGSWCTPSHQSGMATTTGAPLEVTLQLEANETDAVRSVQLILRADTASAVLEIWQKIYVDEAKWETATTAVVNMKVGWNLGNTLDSYGEWIELWTSNKPSDYETAWGNPITTRAMIARFREVGFNAIRVPVTWDQHIDADNNVEEAWMQRVEEVVGYVLDEGMYCILNVHHDTGTEGWLQADLSNYGSISMRYRKLWDQIANRFNKYDKHLIFESYNEMLDKQGRWTETNADGYKAQNALLQDFVEVVRGTGGNNRYRNLSINTYSAAHSPLTLNSFIVPDDVVEDRLIAQVHVYSPYDFALNENSPVKLFTSQGEQEISDIMERLDQRFITKGIPVIIGEFGAMDKDNMPERVKHAAYLVNEAAKYGIVCFHWMGLLDRNTLEWAEPELVEVIIGNAK